MAKAHIDIKLNQARVSSYSRHAADVHASKAARITADRVKANIVSSGRVRTGAMRDGVRHKRIRDGESTSYGITIEGPAAKYFLFQDQGTRAHGPKTANFMRFQPKGSSSFVFAKWVRGVTPAKFVERAMNRLTLNDFTP